jgi:ABC-type dipeptide/oligopeptide/nickel transport system permease component
MSWLVICFEHGSNGRTMLRYFFRRLITAVLVLFGVTFLTFGLMTIAPGVPALEVAFAR